MLGHRSTRILVTSFIVGLALAVLISGAFWWLSGHDKTPGWPYVVFLLEFAAVFVIMLGILPLALIKGVEKLKQLPRITISPRIRTYLMGIAWVFFVTSLFLPAQAGQSVIKLGWETAFDGMVHSIFFFFPTLVQFPYMLPILLAPWTNVLFMLTPVMVRSSIGMVSSKGKTLVLLMALCNTLVAVVVLLSDLAESLESIPRHLGYWFWVTAFWIAWLSLSFHVKPNEAFNGDVKRTGVLRLLA